MRGAGSVAAFVGGSTTGKFVKFFLFSFLYSVFTFFVFYEVGGRWILGLYAVGFFSFYAAYFDSVGRPVWWVVYFVGYLAAVFGSPRAVFTLLVAVTFFGPLLYGRGLGGRLASMAFFWAGVLASAVVINAVGHFYRLAVPPAYPQLPQALPSPFDIPLYLLGFYILWRIHCLAARWDAAVRCETRRSSPQPA